MVPLPGVRADGASHVGRRRTAHRGGVAALRLRGAPAPVHAAAPGQFGVNCPPRRRFIAGNCHLGQLTLRTLPRTFGNAAPHGSAVAAGGAASPPVPDVRPARRPWPWPKPSATCSRRPRRSGRGEQPLIDAVPGRVAVSQVRTPSRRTPGTGDTFRRAPAINRADELVTRGPAQERKQTRPAPRDDGRLPQPAGRPTEADAMPPRWQSRTMVVREVLPDTGARVDVGQAPA